jgi:pimeloyl-ACP methyl ester carboxylesterase
LGRRVLINAGWYYLVPAEGMASEVRPLLILTNGYDATIVDSWLASGFAATRRGYHCLIFEGSGQGGPLYLHGRSLRPDWETVLRAVVDAVVAQPLVDHGRVALSGWSLGGLLALRAAADEPRIAALVADPGLWSIAEPVPAFAASLGVAPEAAADLRTVPQEVIETMERAIASDRRLTWSFVRRGFWVHGVSDLRGYLEAILPFTLEGRIASIRCPTLITSAEEDPRAATAARVHEALQAQRTLVCFTRDEGAGGHCEMMNRSLLNRRVLDWLEIALG